MLKRIKALAAFALLSAPLYSSHIVGGYMNYYCISSNTFIVQLFLYWDCAGNFPLPADEQIRIYNASNALVTTVTVPKIYEINVPPTTTNPCLSPPSWVCVHEGMYETTITLANAVGGYTLATQICCRNGAVDNIVNPGIQGATYMAKVPDPGATGCNDAPVFFTFPPIAICNLDTFKYDHHATDINGDSIVYRLCDAKDAPQFGPPTPPPFASVPYVSPPYSPTYPMAASTVPLTINSATGMLKAFPNGLGTFVVAICMDEYRNGVKIGEYRREIEFNVVSCVVAVNPQVGNITSGPLGSGVYECESFTVNFQNTSTGAPYFWWDFGTGNPGDTSRLLAPSFTYTDTGTYDITLIANPGYVCADTAYAKVFVYPGTKAGFSWSTPHCVNVPVQFTDTSLVPYGNVTSREWTFTGGNPGTSNQQNPLVTFATPGVKTITLIIETDLGCTDTVTKSIQIVGNPILNVPGDITLCVGTDTQLVATGIGTYQWTPPGSGLSCYTCANPIAAPTVGTTYSVTLTSGFGCQTTKTIRVDLADYPVLNAGNDTVLCNAGSVQMNAVATDTSGITTWQWTPSAGLSNTTTPNPIANPIGAGIYTYCVTATNPYGCDSTDCMVIKRNMISVNAGPDVIICQGVGSQLNGTSPTPGITWQWLPNTALTPSNSIPNPVANPPSTTTYTVTVTDADNCQASDQVVITINMAPPVDAGLNTSVCLGYSTTLNATGAPSYQWTADPTLSCTACQSPTATPSVTTTYYVTGTGANGCTAMDSVTVFVTTEPLVTITSDTFICSGSNIQLTSTGPVGSSFVWTPITGLSDPNISNPIASPASTTTYCLRVTDPSGCFKDTCITIIVRPLPSVNAFNAAMCDGTSAQLIAVGGVTYSWMPGAMTGTPVTVSPAVTTTYTVTGTDAWGCQDTDPATVTVLPLPNINAGADLSICNGQSATLTATGGASYSWQPGGLSGSSVTVNPTTTTTYTVTGTAVDGCQNVDQVTITVDTIPVVTATTTDPDVCAGISTTLNASGASTYNWVPGSIPGSSVSVTPPISTTYTVTGTDGNGCSSTATIVITVYPLPGINAGADQDICENGSANLIGTGAGIGGTYLWQPGAIAGSTITVNPALTTTYTLTGTDAQGCSNTDMVTVIIHFPPAISAGADQSICIGSTTTLTASGGATYVWQPGAVPGASIPVGPIITTTYTVTGTDIYGCVNSDSVTVTVNPVPAIQATTATPDICPGANAVLNATGGATYNWQPGNLPGTPVTVSPSTSTTYTVTGTDGNGCSATATVTVNLFNVQPVDAGVDVSICIGESAQLLATGANTYAWAGSDLSDNTIPDPIASPSTTTNYMVTGTDINGCQSTDFVQVEVNPLPVITANADLYIYEGECIALWATGGLSYLWTPAATLDDPTSDKPLACPGETTTYYVAGTDAKGCDNVDSTVVYVIGIPVVEVPTAFTPNGDGLNDIFRIEHWLHFELVSMRVINRWGDLVFLSNDILAGWDGTMSGKDQPIGSYVYLVSGIDEKGAVVWRQGNVTLLR